MRTARATVSDFRCACSAYRIHIELKALVWLVFQDAKQLPGCCLISCTALSLVFLLQRHQHSALCTVQAGHVKSASGEPL